MISVGGPVVWGIFAAVVIIMLALDLGVFHRKAHVVGFREAAVWSLVWIGLALLFNVLVYFQYGSDRALEFFQAWLIEKALSVDNIFVFLAAFSYFGVPARLQHRVLFWGIIGALVTRGLFILLGAALLAAFHWVMYVFGVTRDVFIVYTSNIFAVFGLRALCFLVASLVRRLRYLKPALAFVLAFVGGKMLVADRYHISDAVSLAVVGGLILGAGLLSWLLPARAGDSSSTTHATDER